MGTKKTWLFKTSGFLKEVLIQMKFSLTGQERVTF